MNKKREVRSATEDAGKNFAVRGLNHEMISRIQSEIARVGTKAAVAKEAGIPLSTLNDALAGGTEPRFSVVSALARHFGRSVEWLERGEEPSALVPDTDFVAVPLLPEAASMGDGRDAEANDSIVDRLVMFRREWVSRLGINPLRAHVLPVVGDSMEPTLLGGDVVLCDTGDQSLGGGGVFVVNTEDGPVVKRLERDDEGVVLVVSDNKRHRVRRVVPPFSDTFRIIGRVRWYARTLR